MKIIPNKNYKKAFTHNNVRYVLMIGGRASGRSYTASQIALLNLVTKDYYRCAIMRYVQGDIRNSIFQEIKDRIEEHELEKNVEIKDSVLSFGYGHNKITSIGFRKSSSDQKAKLKSLANYNEVFIEEAEEVSEEDFIQLDDSLRTKKGDVTVYLMLNPPNKDHWIIKKWFNLEESEVEGFYKYSLKSEYKDNTLFIFGTYKGNIKNLDKNTVANFERYKETNPDHYWNMIMGLVSSGKRGLIFKDWTPMSKEEFDKLEYPSFYGLDFGYSNDPTALLEIKTHNNKVYFRELIYRTGLTNQDIDKEMRTLEVSKTAYIYGDSAEPKSIEELKRLGWNIHPAEKGQGSVNAGISKLLESEVYYTDDSKNLAREKENYQWSLDKNKEPTNDPIDDFNHLMDAGRYGVFTNANKKGIGFF